MGCPRERVRWRLSRPYRNWKTPGMNSSMDDTIGRLYASARKEIGKVIVGHEAAIEQILVSLFAGGHVLIEGIPGTAKTLLVRVVARLFDCAFKRIQFTPGDEINRAPAKTQSALLEAMQERQVTVDGTSYRLPGVFTVFATQNPIEQEGTYPLPEAQLDRFMMKVVVRYPDEAQEVAILRTHQQGIRVEDLERFGLQRVGGV